MASLPPSLENVPRPSSNGAREASEGVESNVGSSRHQKTVWYIKSSCAGQMCITTIKKNWREKIVALPGETKRILVPAMLPRLRNCGLVTSPLNRSWTDPP